MTNYIKSEIYRIVHDKGIYIFTMILVLLSVSFNFVLYLFRKIDGPNFSYATVSYSLSNLVANPMVFCLAGTIIGVVLYEGNRKNGNLKNTISFGIPRVKIFAGQCMVATITALMIMLIVLAFYLPSTLLLLEPSGPVTFIDLLTEIPAILLIAIASLISGIICIEVFTKESTGILVWAAIWFVIPKIIFYLGLRIAFLYQIAMWMPANMFGTSGMTVNLTQCITAWGTVNGMLKCLLAGITGVVIFFIWGMIALKNKEL